MRVWSKAGDLEATVEELPTMKASGKRREENQLRRGTIYSSDWSSRREADRRELPTGWRSHLRQEGQHPARGREGLSTHRRVARRGPASRRGAQCS